METHIKQNKQEKDEDEYVLLDLDGACLPADILPNASYVLSGLDTMNPELVIGDSLKLIGEYQETMGMCYVFSERDEETVVLYPERGSSERNLFKEKSIVDSNSAASKKVQTITGLQKVLKFRRANEDEMTTATSIPATSL